MKSTRRKNIVFVFLLTLLLLVAIPVVLTVREVRRQQRNRTLIAAIRGNQKAAVLALLEQGADPAIRDNATDASSFWPLLVSRFRGRKAQALPDGPSALLLALQWRPEPPSSAYPALIADSDAIVAALLKRQSKLDAPEIIARMARTYAFCASYQDTGEVNVKLSVSSNYLERKRFQTAFVRPDRFFYSRRHQLFRGSSSLDKTDYRVVWQAGKNVHEWWDGHPEVLKSDDLNRGIGRETSLDGGIPHLLMPDNILGLGLDRMAKPRLMGMETIGTSLCYCIDEGRPTGSKGTMWIDARTFFIRRIAEHIPTANTYFDVTTTYNPQLNPPIAAEVFAFTPPQKWKIRTH